MYENMIKQNEYENGINTEFFLNGKYSLARRYLLFLPSIGDEVRFDGVAYRVTHRIFTYDEESPRVAVNTVKVKTNKTR